MNNKNNIAFVTISATGEKPVAEIHIVGFDRDKTLDIASQLEGTGGNLMLLFADAVEKYCRVCKDEAGMPAVKLFASLVAGALAKAAGGTAAVVGSPEELRAVADRLEEKKRDGEFHGQL